MLSVAITAGNQWSSYFNTIGTHLDPSYTLGYYLYSSLAGGPYRSSNTVKYANSFGPVALELDARFNDANEGSDVAEKIAGNGYGLGLTFNATDNLLIALAVDSEDGDDESSDVDRQGIAVKGSFGGVSATLGYQQTDDGSDADVEQVQLWLGGNIGDKNRWSLGYGEVDGGGNATPTAVNLGFYHAIGGGLKLYYEGISLDADGSAERSDLDKHLFGMRIDF